MTIYNTYYINGNSSNSYSSSSSSNNFFMTSTNTANGTTYSSNDGVIPYVSPFSSHVNHDPKHPHRPAFGMSMNESIFDCKRGGHEHGHVDRGHHGGGSHHGNGNHYAGVHYPKHMPIPLVPTKDKHHGCA